MDKTRSDKNKALLEAFSKGYEVSECGEYLYTPFSKLTKKTFVQGYPTFAYRLGDKKINVMWHRLQAYQKYGEKLFEDGMVVRHFDSNKLNCSKNNILIGTESENSMDKPEEDRMKYSLNAVKSIRKYNATEVREFHKQNGNSARKTMLEFNMTSKGSLYYVLKLAKHS